MPLVFYIGAIFWTLGYDTIYGYQDIKDDEIIGVKSTSIKFKKSPKKFLILCYLVFLLNLLITGFIMELNSFFYSIYILIALQMFYFQLRKLDIKDSLKCFKIFKSNNFLGLLVFVSLIGGKI